MDTHSGKLSNSLRERLKRCGRYHSSPKSAPGQPVMVAKQQNQHSPESSDEEYDIMKEDSPFPKHPCINLDSGDACKTEVSYQNKSVTDFNEIKNCPQLPVTSGKRIPIENEAENCDLQSTPNITKSRSLVKIKGSKLRFDNNDSDRCSNIKLKADELNNQTPKTEHKDSDQEACENSSAIKVDSSDKETKLIDRSCEDKICDSSDVTVLEKELKKQEDTLRKLNLVKMYRTKNNLEELQTLIDKWRSISQQALQDLLDDMPEPKPSLTELINHLGIEHSLVQFNAKEDETFY